MDNRLKKAETSLLGLRGKISFAVELVVKLISLKSLYSRDLLFALLFEAWVTFNLCNAKFFIFTLSSLIGTNRVGVHATPRVT